jgi:hypothetical protein
MDDFFLFSFSLTLQNQETCVQFHSDFYVLVQMRKVLQSDKLVERSFIARLSIVSIACFLILFLFNYGAISALSDAMILY